MTPTAPNSFDRGKPFYPLVMNFLTQLLGFKELAIRGMVGRRSIDDAMSQLGGPTVISDQALASLRQSLEAVMGPLELRSEFSANPIRVDVDDIAREIAQNSTYLADSLLYALGAVFILAHEMSIEKPWHDQGPLWEFLRHCRHAAAHGGRFNLRSIEPRRPAKWGPFEITPSLQGTPLFKRTDGSGMLSPGDPIRLLWDIEQSCPQMSV